MRRASDSEEIEVSTSEDDEDDLSRRGDGEAEYHPRVAIHYSGGPAQDHAESDATDDDKDFDDDDDDDEDYGGATSSPSFHAEGLWDASR